MTILWKNIEDSIKGYRDDFRRTDLPVLEISGIYVLTPPEEPNALCLSRLSGLINGRIIRKEVFIVSLAVNINCYILVKPPRVVV